MKRKALAFGGAVVLALVAAFTLINLVKAAVGLAIVFFAGRGLMRLWMSGHSRHQSGHMPQGAVPYQQLAGSGYYHPHPGVHPVYGSTSSKDRIVPIF
jgi:hypothetical protein